MLIGSTKLLKTFIFTIILLTLFLFGKSFYFYNEYQLAKENDIKKEAQILSEYLISTRKIYHEQAIANQSFDDLPNPHISLLISDEFSRENPFNINIKNVSKRPANPKNKADKFELQAIDYFEKNRNKSEFFLKYEDKGLKYFLFAKPLYVKQSCLQCHGAKENISEHILNKYKNNAFDYNLGDLRGIVSTKIPQINISQTLDVFIKKEVLYFLLIIFLICVILFLIYKQTRYEMAKNQELAIKDSLTNLYNRHFLKTLDTSLFSKKSYFIVFFDIDHFKKVNDNYGHICGDHVLKEFAFLLESFTREKDFLCRFGGEEFVLIIDNIEEQILAEKLEKIRLNIMTNNFIFNEDIIQITTSIGYCKSTKKSTFQEVLTKADEALYLAKQSGRNKVEKKEIE